ncbi:uncharacterized protein LOC116263093 [Nymphaea colorata]|nr:uncharacterized protein LOC116263093 [Nymphaea colorata]
MHRDFTVHQGKFSKSVRLFLIQSNAGFFPRVKGWIQGNFPLEKSRTLEGPTFWRRQIFCPLGLLITRFFALVPASSHRPLAVLSTTAAALPPVVVRSPCSPPQPLLCLQPLWYFEEVEMELYARGYLRLEARTMSSPQNQPSTFKAMHPMFVVQNGL